MDHLRFVMVSRGLVDKVVNILEQSQLSPSSAGPWAELSNIQVDFVEVQRIQRISLVLKKHMFLFLKLLDFCRGNI